MIIFIIIKGLLFVLNEMNPVSFLFFFNKRKNILGKRIFSFKYLKIFLVMHFFFILYKLDF